MTESETNQVTLFSSCISLHSALFASKTMTEGIGEGTLGTPIAGEGAGPSRPRRGPNATILRTLTFTQNVSAAVFSVFVPMHLASPIAAAFGGIGAADQVLVC